MTQQVIMKTARMISAMIPKTVVLRPPGVLLGSPSEPRNNA